MDLESLSRLQTEAVNPHTRQIDQMSTLDMCTVINHEDQQVASSVTPCIPQIAKAIDALVPRVHRGGRVVYVGAGTSGRLGILDASEIPPTFAAPPSQFVSLIAGGDAAIRRAQEGAEDRVSAGEADIIALDLRPELDSVIGIAASGRTPYVLGALAAAKRAGCLTLGVACTSPSAMSLSGNVDFMISPLPGPEVVTGSTRLKAGTATKLVLNMLSTGVMIRMGKTYGNLMVDLVASNEKLKQRSRNILRRLSKRCTVMANAELDQLLEECQQSVKLALLVAETGLPVEKCQRDLQFAQGVLANALERIPTSKAPLSGRFVLCIDGGGSKCAAVVMDQQGNIVGRGRAGPCNVADGRSMSEVVNSLVTATHDALGERTICETATTMPPTLRSLRGYIQAAWIGLAGVDRSGFREKLTPILRETFGITAPDGLRLSNDVALLAATMAEHPETKSAIVLIAGTGSVAIRYQRQGISEEPIRVARSGGWGHTLGDEGGGYAIGLRGIKQTLTRLEEIRLGLREDQLGDVEDAVLRRLGCHVSDPGCIDLVSQLLAHNQGPGTKSQIAAAAEAVLSVVKENAEAMTILDDEIQHLVDHTLGRLLNPKCAGFLSLQETGLILSGGLFGHPAYRDHFSDILSAKNLQFAYTQRVGDAALAGATSLVPQLTSGVEAG